MPLPTTPHSRVSETRKPVTTLITLIRHGETAWNRDGRIQGHLQIPLNTRGLRQAEATAEALGSERIDAIYSSDLIRASCTAAAIARTAGQPVRMEPQLREWDLGALSGLVKEEAEQRCPDAYRIYRDRIIDTAIRGGESIRSRHRRVTDCIAEIAARHDGERIVIVTHGGPLGDSYRHATGTKLGDRLAVHLYNAGINRIQVSPGDWRILCWGELDHLTEIGSLANWEARSDARRPP